MFPAITVNYAGNRTCGTGSTNWMPAWTRAGETEIVLWSETTNGEPIDARQVTRFKMFHRRQVSSHQSQAAAVDPDPTVQQLLSCFEFPGSAAEFHS